MFDVRLIFGIQNFSIKWIPKIKDFEPISNVINDQPKFQNINNWWLKTYCHDFGLGMLNDWSCSLHLLFNLKQWNYFGWWLIWKRSNQFIYMILDNIQRIFGSLLDYCCSSNKILQKLKASCMVYGVSQLKLIWKHPRINL
jgi:hypothetical protein